MELTKRIADDAKREADALLEQARQAAHARIAAGRRAAEEERERLTQDARQAAEADRQKAISAAHAKARQEILAQKQRLVARVLETAGQRLRALPDAEYAVLLRRMIEKTGLEDCEICVSPKDRQRLCKKLQLSAETVPISGGFIAKGSGVEYNCSFEALFAARAEALEAIAADLLFGKH